MTRAAPLAVLALAACAPVAELQPIDEVTVQVLRNNGDEPSIVRPVNHELLVQGATDPAGLEAALVAAGFDVIGLERDPGREALVTLRSDTREPTLARQIAWLEANAPAYGYVHTGWGTSAQPG